MLVVLHALGSRAAYDGSQGAPLRGVKLRQVQQLFFFFPGPLRFFYGRVEPLVPPRLALLGTLPVQQRSLIHTYTCRPSGRMCLQESGSKLA
jgi:hypothetical protein